MQDTKEESTLVKFYIKTEDWFEEVEKKKRSDFEDLPRTGETVTLESGSYEVLDITHDLSGKPYFIQLFVKLLYR